MPLSQRLGERRAEQLIPGGTLGPVSWGWWRFPASHQAHLASVQAALEGAGLGLHAWSCHRSPGNPLLAAPCSERSPAPPGLAPPPPRRHALCTGIVPPGATSGPPRLLGVCPRCSLCPHFPQLPPALATPLLPWLVPFLQEPTAEPSSSPLHPGIPSERAVSSLCPSKCPCLFLGGGFHLLFHPLSVYWQPSCWGCIS